MKRIIVFCIALLLLVGCGGKEAAAPQVQMDARAQTAAAPAAQTAAPVTETAAPQSVSIASAATAEPAKPAEPVITAGPAPTDAPAQEALADKLLAQWQAAGLTEDMFPLAAADVFDYYGIDLSVCRSGVALGDAVGYANEAVFVEADKAILDQVEAMLQDHLTAVKAQYRGYDAEALALAEKAVLVREGDVVLFIVSPNAEEMLSAFRGLTA